MLSFNKSAGEMKTWQAAKELFIVSGGLMVEIAFASTRHSRCVKKLFLIQFEALR
jgi:hypothetical protein